MGTKSFFPATLATDDPCVADEMSLPTVAWSKTGDVPAATEWDISADLSKRIAEDLGITIGDTWSHIHQPGGFTKADFRDRWRIASVSAGCVVRRPRVARNAVSRKHA